jgi:hypothetical protein
MRASARVCLLAGGDKSHNAAVASTGWAARRAWWRAEAARSGTDWRGILQTAIAAVALARQIAPYTSTFAAACRHADRAPQARRRYQRSPDHLPEATLQAIAFLLKQDDMARLEKFIADRPQAEIAKIREYLRGKIRGRDNT